MYSILTRPISEMECLQSVGVGRTLDQDYSYGSKEAEHLEAMTINPNPACTVSSIYVQHSLYTPFLALNQLDRLIHLQLRNLLS